MEKVKTEKDWKSSFWSWYHYYKYEISTLLDSTTKNILDGMSNKDFEKWYHTGNNKTLELATKEYIKKYNKNELANILESDFDVKIQLNNLLNQKIKHISDLPLKTLKKSITKYIILRAYQMRCHYDYF